MMPKPAIVTLTVFLFIACSQLGMAQTISRADAAAARTWTDHTGQFTIEAKLVEFKDGVVHLKNRDGEILTIRADRLSKADQEYIERSQRIGRTNSLKGMLTKLLAEIAPPQGGAVEICIGENKIDPATGISEATLTDSITQACQASSKFKLAGEFASPPYELRIEAIPSGDKCTLKLSLFDRTTGLRVAQVAGAYDIMVSLADLGYNAAIRRDYPALSAALHGKALRLSLERSLSVKVTDTGGALFYRVADQEHGTLSVWIMFDPGYAIVADTEQMKLASSFNYIFSNLLDLDKIIWNLGPSAVVVHLTEEAQISSHYLGVEWTQLYTSRPDQLQIATVFPIFGNSISAPAPIGSLLRLPDADAAWAQVMCGGVPHAEFQFLTQHGLSDPRSDEPNVIGLDNKACLINGKDKWMTTELVPSPLPGLHNLLAYKYDLDVKTGHAATSRPGFLIAVFFAQPKGRIALTIPEPGKEATGKEKDARLISSRALSTLRVPVPPDTAESTHR